MSESQVIIKFELLPNEIVIECFEYINIFDIYYSFNNLNNHFNQLIRILPLHINFQNILKSLFDKFCKFLLLNSDVKNQIYSLKLSNKNTSGQIDAFFSSFSLNEFSHLQSLTLIEVRHENIKKLKLMLPLIPQLSSFHLIDSDDIILNCPLPTDLQILSIPTLQSIGRSLSSLTISFCSFDQVLNELFKYAPLLEYLKIHYISEDYVSEKNDSNKAVHLKELIIGNFEYQFKDFERFATYIPELTSLELYGNYDIDMIDAKRWESLITSSLPFLDIFKFIFNYIYRSDNDNILDKLNKFQNDFWHKEHQWYTEYLISDYSAFIYTIPYMLNTYTLEIDVKRYGNKILNTFDNVKNLTLYPSTSKESCEYYFSNINSLTILPLEYYYEPNLYEQDIKLLKTIVNLSNLKHLGISVKFKFEHSSILLSILRETPQLSSISIDLHTLDQCHFPDHQLCAHLKMIKKLDIYKYGSGLFENRWDLDSFLKKFPNLEEFKCSIDKANDLLFILKYVPTISILKAYLWEMNDHQYFRSWLKEETHKLNLLFHTKYIDQHETELCIWIDRNIKRSLEK